MKKEIQVVEKKLMMSAREFRDLFSRTDYQVAKTIAFIDNEKEVDDFLNDSKAFITMFNELIDDYEILICETVFIEHVMDNLFQRAQETNFNMTPLIEKYLRWRAESAYKGFINELYASTLLLENLPNVIIIKSEAIDRKEGVDFIVNCLETEMVQRTHVTSSNSRSRVTTKEQRGKERNNERDMIVTYNHKVEDAHSFIKNGFPFFKKKYLLRTFYDHNKNKQKGYKMDDPQFIKKLTQYGGVLEIYRSNQMDPSYEDSIQKFIKVLENKI